MGMHSLGERLEAIKDKMKSDKFINGRGLGNEISFYIFEYNPKNELYVREQIEYIIKDFNRVPSNEKIIEFDLYKMLIAFLKEEEDFEAIIRMEEKEGKEYTLETITTVVTSEMYAERIEQMSKDYGILFITGVGKVYPYLRAHNILNTLQQNLDKNKKLIMFYPGIYSGQDLKLFDRFEDENYYRAFQLI